MKDLAQGQPKIFGDVSKGTQYTLSISLEKDQWYTLSVQGEFEENEFIGVWLGTDKYIGCLLDNKITFKPKQNYTDVTITLKSLSGGGTIHTITLVKDIVEWPWTPAPEDLTKINTIDHNSYLVENNTIHTLKLYNRALTDEEIMRNYRATHFLLEPKTFTSTNYYNFYDLNRVEINTLATKDLIEILIGKFNIDPINIDRDMTSIEFAESLNRIERNINTLKNNFYRPSIWTEPKTYWHYNDPFDFEDANRLENNLLHLFDLAKGNIDKIPYCGMYTCGGELI